MSVLLPLIQELLPMLMPSDVHIARAADLEDQAQAQGRRRSPRTSSSSSARSGRDATVTQRDAIVNKCDKMCASVLVLKPNTSSPVRHHGEQDTILYTVSGRGVLLVKPDLEAETRRHELGPGDFAFVPAWTEHQMVNETGRPVEGEAKRESANSEGSRQSETASGERGTRQASSERKNMDEQVGQTGNTDDDERHNEQSSAAKVGEDTAETGETAALVKVGDGAVAGAMSMPSGHEYPEPGPNENVEADKPDEAQEDGKGTHVAGEDVMWVVVRSGSQPVVVDLTDWGGDHQE